MKRLTGIYDRIVRAADDRRAHNTHCTITHGNTIYNNILRTRLYTRTTCRSKSIRKSFPESFILQVNIKFHDAIVHIVLRPRAC